MEVVSYISIGAVGALLLAKLVDVLKQWLSSPVVQQFVTMAMMVRDSMPPMIVNTTKQIVLVVAQALHLILHVAFQVGVFVKNMYHMILVIGKSIYVVLYSVNDFFTYIWNFSDNILTPFTNWMVQQPVRTVNWQRIMMILLISTCISMTRRYIAYKRKLKQN